MALSGFSQADLIKMGPDEVERKRKLAEALLAGSQSTAPIGSWTQGAARLAQALSGKLQESRLDKIQKAGTDQAAAATNAVNWGSIFGNQPTGAAKDAPAYPASVAAGGSPTAPAATGVVDPSQIKKGLMQRGLPEQVADGFVMNFQDESGLNPGINEQNPTVPGSRGGFGLAQWTGPRRRAYESFAAERGVNPADTDAQLDFLVSELQGPEANAAKSIMAAPDSGTAAAAIAKNFLRPAQEHLDARVAKYMSQGSQPVQVASLDPSVGMGQPQAPVAPTQPQAAQPMPAQQGNVGIGQVPAGSGGQPVLDVTQMPQLSAAAGIPFQQPSGMSQQAPANPMAQALIQGGQGQQGGLSPQGMAAHDKALGGILAGNQPQQVNPQQAKMAQALLGSSFPAAPTMTGNESAAPVAQPGYLNNAPQSAGQQAPQDNVQQLMAVINQPFASREQKMMAMQALQQIQQRNDPSNQLDMQMKQAQLDALKAKPTTKFGFQVLPDGTLVRTNESTGDASPIMQGGEKPTSDMQEYKFAQQQGFKGSFVDFQLAQKKAGATSVNVNGEPNDGALRKALGEQTGKLWSTYQQAGTVSASNAQDFQVLDELLKTAPQGPVQGRLAEMFPGMSSSGAAFNSIVKRIAPTLRAPGSGSTSDIEYDGMLKSLPALSNKPEANQIIAGIMKAKADLNIQRSAIVDRYASGQLTETQARQQLGEMDKKSIISPEMQKILGGFSPQTSDDGGTAPEGIDPADWKFMTPEERKLFQ